MQVKLTLNDWSPWKRTFLLLPKVSISGKKIMGFAWVRTKKDSIIELENDVGYFCELGIEYASSKKEIFLKELK